MISLRFEGLVPPCPRKSGSFSFGPTESPYSKAKRLFWGDPKQSMIEVIIKEAPL